MKILQRTYNMCHNPLNIMLVIPGVFCTPSMKLSQLEKTAPVVTEGPTDGCAEDIIQAWYTRSHRSRICFSTNTAFWSSTSFIQLRTYAKTDTQTSSMVGSSFSDWERKFCKNKYCMKHLKFATEHNKSIHTHINGSVIYSEWKQDG